MRDHWDEAFINDGDREFEEQDDFKIDPDDLDKAINVSIDKDKGITKQDERIK